MAVAGTQKIFTVRFNKALKIKSDRLVKIYFVNAYCSFIFEKSFYAHHKHNKLLNLI